MKKSLLAVLLGAFTLASTAHAGLYAEGNVGVVKSKFSSYSSLNKTKIEPQVAVGYKLGNVRVAGDYSHHGKFDGDANGTSTSAKIQGLGASVLYDFDIDSNVAPYVGARLALNRFSVTNRGTTHFSDASETKLGYGVVAGAKYKLDQKWYANGGVEYNRLGTFDDTKVSNYGAKVGVGYEF